jgi:mannose-6-phosphate isomerase
MSAISKQPLRFEPILRRLIWGGRRLGTVLGKPIGESDDYAESWEISDYKDAVSVVCEGPLAGMSLRELVRSQPGVLMGNHLADRDQFPLLVKFIDARETLSVQVHPDDEKGRRLANDNGKTETWVVVDAEPGSLIYSGLKPGVTRDQFAAAIEAGTVEPLLHRFVPRPGDCIMIEAGTVHAIGAGVLLAEIQQMSDATFRVDDWGRLGPDGRPRELHVRQAIESTDFTRGPVDPLVPRVLSSASGNRREGLSRCPYFELERWSLTRPEVLGHEGRFTILNGLKGSARVRHESGSSRLDFGQTLLLPAVLGPRTVEPDGEAVVLTCVVP